MNGRQESRMSGYRGRIPTVEEIVDAYMKSERAQNHMSEMGIPPEEYRQILMDYITREQLIRHAHENGGRTVDEESEDTDSKN